MSSIVKDLRVNPRYDLVSPYVFIRYEQQQNVDGVSWLVPIVDQWPNPLPTDPIAAYNGLRFTVDLQGTSATSTTADLVCDFVDFTNPNWWLARHPQYLPYDAANGPPSFDDIVSVDFGGFASLARVPTDAGDVDQGFTNELRTGQIAKWMTAFSAQRITVSVTVTITRRNTDVEKNHVLTYQFLSTNATTGTYQNQTVSAFPEPVPVGLARQLYNAVSVLQFEGELVLQEEEVSASLSVGNLFNLTGGALAEWATMAAQVQQITENLDTGQTTVQFGPPKHLSAGELVDLLRVNRNRVIRYNYYVGLGTITGSGASGGQVGLGKNTPEKNSASRAGYDQTHVVSGKDDGTGPQINTTSDGVAACQTMWLLQPPNPANPNPPGSVSIRLADIAGTDVANGVHLKIQKIAVCQNGVQGSMYFLRSDFIPDA